MTTHFSTRPNRQQRRAAARLQAKAMVNLTDFPLNAIDVLRVGDAAEQVAGDLVAAEFGLPRSICEAAGAILLFGASDLPQEVTLGQMRAPLLAFAAAELLRREGIAARPVAGRAIWSVGAGNDDTLDHGVETTGTFLGDVTSGRYHTWLEIGGCVVDFAARELPQKFARAHSLQPFSTSPANWRQFPPTIIHPLHQRMPNPLSSRQGAYAYHDCGPAMLACVQLWLANFLVRL